LKNNDVYALLFRHFSASSSGTDLLAKKIQNGFISKRDLSVSSLRDGIPDSWRVRHFGSLFNMLTLGDSDADGDGLLNHAEFLAGTNPNDSKSALQLASRAAGAGVQLQWATVAGKRYIIEASPTLYGSNWEIIGADIVGDGQVQFFTDSTAAHAGETRFYRVRVAGE
jgi:hypothetical protein